MEARLGLCILNAANKMTCKTVAFIQGHRLRDTAAKEGKMGREKEKKIELAENLDLKKGVILVEVRLELGG